MVGILKRFSIVATISVLTVMGCVSLRATTYEAVTFDQLVSQADVIFVGTVVDTTPFAINTRQGTIIKTRVTFRHSTASRSRAPRTSAPAVSQPQLLLLRLAWRSFEAVSRMRSIRGSSEEAHPPV